jgi:hypothetical protein
LRQQVLHGPAHVLRRCIGEVQPRHQVVRLLGLDRAPAAVQVGHQGGVAGLGQAIGHAADLRVQAPPLLDHDDGRPAGRGRPGGFGQVAFDGLSVGTLEADLTSHSGLLGFRCGP